MVIGPDRSGELFHHRDGHRKVKQRGGPQQLTGLAGKQADECANGEVFEELANLVLLRQLAGLGVGLHLP